SSARLERWRRGIPPIRAWRALIQPFHVARPRRPAPPVLTSPKEFRMNREEQLGPFGLQQWNSDPAPVVRPRATLLCLSIMAGGMLGWAIRDWQLGMITPGDVVMVSALTFRILHGSRDLALALVDTSQQLGVISETLRIIVQPHALSDVPETLHESHGNIRFIDASYTYADGRSA